MTEARFFRGAAVVAVAAVIALVIRTRLGAKALPHILPFGEPWLTILSVVGWWLLIVVAAHVVRWLYLGVTGRGPDLGH
jgi:hypothetical protein